MFTHILSSQSVWHCQSVDYIVLHTDYSHFSNVYSSTSISSPGETMPRSDSAESQSQAIQEEPLPSTSNEEEDPLAGKFYCTPMLCH